MIARRQLLAGLTAAAAWSGSQATARVRGGTPDLQGLWSVATGTPLERPKTFKTLTVSEAEARAYEVSQKGVLGVIPGDDVGQLESEWLEPNLPLTRIHGEARTSVVVDPPNGRLPYSPAGRQTVGLWFARMNDFRGPEGRPAAERCMIGFGTPAGAPLVYAPHTAGVRQIVQTRDHLVIRAEDNSDLRVIYLDAQNAPPQPVRPWMGVSTGRWEGQTLVVETTRFSPSETLRSLPVVLYMSPDARVTERFTRTAPDTIFYAFTVDDPAVFTEPWRGESLLSASRQRMFESACHEGNYSLANILAGARRAEHDRLAAEKPR
jgi:hypothetical protein